MKRRGPKWFCGGGKFACYRLNPKNKPAWCTSCSARRRDAKHESVLRSNKSKPQ
jgi:hypothetical protein